MGMGMLRRIGALGYRDGGKVLRLNAVFMHVALRHKRISRRYADAVGLLELRMPYLREHRGRAARRQPGEPVVTSHHQHILAFSGLNQRRRALMRWTICNGTTGRNHLE